MLTLIIEIYLTCKAWKAGWGAVALIPIISVHVISFIIGFVFADSITSIEDLYLPCILLEVGCISALGIMAYAKRDETLSKA
jgi:hypothetical protein